MAISSIAFFSSGVNDGLEIDRLTAGAGSYTLAGLNGVPSVSHSKAASRLSSGSCIDSLLIFSLRKVVRNDGLARFYMKHSGSLFIAAGSGLHTYDLPLRLSRFLNMFFQIIEFWSWS